MKKRIVAMLALTLTTSACAAERRSLGHLVVLANRGEYVFSVTESDIYGSDRTLQITCAGCSGVRPYQERATGFPLGIYRLSDADTLVIVTWAAATNTRVQVFRIGDTRIDKVFDRRSAVVPVVTEADGRLRLITSEYPEEGAGADRPLMEHVWLWTGSEFTKIVP